MIKRYVTIFLILCSVAILFFHSSTVSVIAMVIPPTQTTITLTVDGNDNTVENDRSTNSTSITFHVTATQGINPIAGFDCTLDRGPAEPCAVTSTGVISYNNLTAGQQHIFKVVAVDNQGNADPIAATFSWTVLASHRGIEQLISTVDRTHLSEDTTLSLEAPLTTVITLLNNHQDTAACYSVNAFLDLVEENEASGQITSQQSDDLRQQATAIQQATECSLPFP